MYEITNNFFPKERDKDENYDELPDLKRDQDEHYARGTTEVIDYVKVTTVQTTEEHSVNVDLVGVNAFYYVVISTASHKIDVIVIVVKGKN